MRIELSRELTGKERIDVNYKISGAKAGVHYRDRFLRRDNDTSITRLKRNDGSRRVRFTAGAQMATIRLVALNNNDQTNRVLNVNLGGGHQPVLARHVTGGVNVAQSELTVSITDDDKPQQVLPEVTIAGRLPLSEGKPARFLVTATPSPALPLNVLVHFVPDETSASASMIAGSRFRPAGLSMSASPQSTIRLMSRTAPLRHRCPCETATK